jgi:putative membrane protein
MVINDDIFAKWYCDVYDNLDAFKGKKCKYLAQVYSVEDFEENQFLAGRYFMVCCAADLVGYGMVCESDKRSELKDEEWITVEGTIGEYEYNGYMVPLLTDVTITEAEAPDVTYIYYNNY